MLKYQPIPIQLSFNLLKIGQIKHKLPFLVQLVFRQRQKDKLSF